VARLIRTEKEVEGRYTEQWVVVEGDDEALDQWPQGPRDVVGQPAPRQDGHQRARGQAGGGHAGDGGHEQARPDPVREHLELRPRRRARLGGRPALPGPVAKPRSHRRDQGEIAEGRDQQGGDRIHATADRRQPPHDQPVEQRDRDEGRPHPRPAQPPADTGGPEALVSIHCTGE